MQQTIVSVVLPVSVSQAGALQQALDALHARVKPADFAVLRDRLPTLHFFSMVVFEGTAADQPLFVLEANVDGLPGPFWAELEDLAGEDLRGVLRLCLPPDGAEVLFASITAPGSRAPMAPLLDCQSVFPAAGHMGNRGLSCVRVQAHDALFQAAQQVLPPPAAILAGGATAIHDWLRIAMLARGFTWLDSPFTAQVSPQERSADRWTLARFALLAIVVAIAPWLLLGAVWRPAPAAVAALLAGIACLTQLQDIGDLALLAGAPATIRAGERSYPNAWLMAAGVLLLALVLPLDFARTGTAAWLTLAVAGLFASLLGLLAVLRRRERADPIPPDSMPVAALVAALRNWEDCHSGGPDHMASLVVVKLGRLRAFLLRFGMRALGLAVRVIATDGYLGSMRTIHFAHWAIVDGGKRLLFLSNFDGSWESYLDDFIEKAHAGLTLAWGNCTGFPAAEYLTLKGATQGRLFKDWARCSMTPSRFWYAAYPTLTVNQIVRQASLAQGLAARRLSPADATLWAAGL